MAATILVKEAVWSICCLLNDEKDQFSRWPEMGIVGWINDARRAITKYLPAAFSRVDAIKLRPGTLQSIESIAVADCKPGDGSTPTVPIIGSQLLDVICNMGADGLTPGRAIRLITDGREAMDAQNPNWHSQTAAAVRNVLFDPRAPRHFHVTPGVPTSPAVWIRACYAAQPIPIPNTGVPGSELYLFSGGSTAKLDLDDEFFDDIVNYACARAFMKNSQVAGSGPSAAAYTSLFTGSINAKVAAITGNNPNLQRLPFAPEPIAQAS